MARIVMQIETGNAAFEDNPFEVNDILKRGAQVMLRDSSGVDDIDVSLWDTNGNKVGFIKSTDDELEPVDGFAFELETGNEAMDSLDDVAELLNALAEKDLHDGLDRMPLRDLNGNTVGHFEATEAASYRPRP